MFRCRYLLSDGVASVKAIISESIYNRLAHKPKRFDIIRVTSLKKIEVKKADSGTQWLVNLTAPVEVLLADLTHVLGHPQEINSLNSAKVDFTQLVAIQSVPDENFVE